MTAEQPPAPATADAQLEFLTFHQRLFELTPRVRIVPTILAINVAVFIAMVASGVSIIAPTGDSVLAWGADYGPRTLGGQPWRLITNVFIHFGVIHLGLNMLALWNAGGVVERIFGPVAFASLYLAAGLTGSVASTAIHPQTVSAGASGAVFGVYGALAAFLARQRGVIPLPVLTKLRGVALSFIAFNIMFGFTNKSIDNAAHIGGLVGGALAGALLARPLEPGRPTIVARSLMVMLGAGALAALAVVALPRPLDFEKTVGDFFAMEGPVLDRYNGLIRDEQSGKIHDDVFVAALEKDVIPTWRKAHAQLALPRAWPAHQKRVIDLLIRYADARERGFTTFAAAVRSEDKAMANKANTHHEIAQQLIEELKAVKPE